jgi:hypothetical protein
VTINEELLERKMSESGVETDINGSGELPR